MITSLAKQAGRKYPQMRAMSASVPQFLPSAGVLILYGDFLHGRLSIQPALRGRIDVRPALGGQVGINP